MPAFLKIKQQLKWRKTLGVPIREYHVFTNPLKINAPLLSLTAIDSYRETNP